MKILRLILLLSLLLLFADCKKKNKKTVGGKLTNITFVSCGWMIKLDEQDTDGNDMIQPMNLGDFSVTLAEGQHVSVAYRAKEAQTACTIGKTVTIDSIVDN